jgi:hypothetical protein
MKYRTENALDEIELDETLNSLGVGERLFSILSSSDGKFVVVIETNAVDPAGGLSLLTEAPRVQ